MNKFERQALCLLEFMNYEDVVLQARRLGFDVPSIAWIHKQWFLRADPCDDCSHWVGNMPESKCLECSEVITDPDHLNSLCCADCAHTWREENEVCHQCGAPLVSDVIGESENEGYIYGERHCPTCSD